MNDCVWCRRLRAALFGVVMLAAGALMFYWLSILHLLE